MIDKAIAIAAHAHRRQLRKGSEVPYISHPYAVGMILARSGFAPEVVAAGILHDTVEDTDLTLDELRDGFGPEIADIVSGCTEPDKSLSWETRKEESLARLAVAPETVKAVLCADKIHNLRTLREDLALFGEAVWSRFKRGREPQRWYHVEAARILADHARYSDRRAFFLRVQDEVRWVFPD